MPDPSLATDLANAYADEYIRYGFDQQADANMAAQQFLLERVRTPGREVQHGRGNHAEFPRANGAGIAR